jgi:hypothetical protein
MIDINMRTLLLMIAVMLCDPSIGTAEGRQVQSDDARGRTAFAAR